jgi:hypothetical protein
LKTVNVKARGIHSHHCDLEDKTDYLKRNRGKEIPLQAWIGPEGSRSLRLPDFKTLDT